MASVVGPSVALSACPSICSANSSGRNSHSSRANFAVAAMAADGEYPGQATVIERMGPAVSSRGRWYKKTASAFARRAEDGETVETVFDGKVETTNTAGADDWIIRADTDAKERYILPGAKFLRLYDTDLASPIPRAHPDVEELDSEGFMKYPSKNRIMALQMTAEDVEANFEQGHFMAAWGQPMLIEPGDFLAATVAPSSATAAAESTTATTGEGCEEFTEMYRIEQKAFFQTYALEEEQS